jgi:catechol 2,3-dioxygenase
MTVSPSIGHVHLRVSDLEQSIAFYSGLLGFTVTQRYGAHAVFLAGGGYHHHIGLNTWESAGATPPPAGHTGLFHTAVLYPDAKALGRVLAALETAGITLDGAADHGVSQSVYLRDPDQNGVELTIDKPQDAWPRDADGNLRMVNDPLDVAAIRALAD